MKTTIYICADSTLTYGPYGGKDKIIKAAIPIAHVEDEGKAISLITLIGKSAYDTLGNDADFKETLEGRTITPGYGPKSRYLYFGEEFEKNNVETIPLVMQRLSKIIEELL